MLVEKSSSEIKYWFSSRNTIENIPIILFYDYSQFTIPIATQAPIINVSRTDNSPFIVNDHKLTVNINYLSNRFVVQDAVCSKSEKINVIVDVKVF